MGAASDAADGTQGDGETAADAARLRAEVDALLLDPRGRFRPRARVLRDAVDGGERVVMQVGEDARGGICVVTAQALPTDGSWLLDDDARPLRLAGARAGHRPEDAQAPCWISVLRAAD
ncbi:hypothetical protein GALL_357740 [mine drainage metagenome]|jgi:hypothetical protein|uniref:Uncharacterized protein n=1 Tax=mine drainage metagenome TaxID=410659 RepID=A0A1J5QFX3_9ZZZZ